MNTPRYTGLVVHGAGTPRPVISGRAAGVRMARPQE